MINMLKNVLRPIYVDTLQEDEDIFFDGDNSHWPISLKVDDLFDSKFKLTVRTGAMTKNRDVVFVCLYEGIHWLLKVAENVPPNSGVAIGWTPGEEPTIREFIESMEGSITETTTIPLTWETGYRIDETHFYKTDEIPTSIYVEVPGPDLLMMAVVAGIIIGTGAIAYSLLKKPAVARA